MLLVLSTGFDCPLNGVSFVHRGLVTLSRNEPLKALPPDLVIEFTTPPVKRPYSAEIAPVRVVVSWTASSTNTGCTWLRTFSVTTTPLTMTRLSYPGEPEIENWPAENVLALMPADNSAAASGERPTGSASICLAVIVVATCGVSRTDGAAAVTVMASATLA